MPASSPMLKLDREIESVKCQSCSSVFFTYLSVVIPSSFMKEEDDPTFYGKWVIGFRNGKEEGASLATQLFLLLNN